MSGNYIIAYDENGSPFIAHANTAATRMTDGGGRGSKPRFWQNHKYLAKVVRGGRTIYAYTQQELDALYGRGKKAVNAAKNAGKQAKEKVKDVLGYDERDRRDQAWKAMQQTNSKNSANSATGAMNRGIAKANYDQAANEYSKTALGKVEYLTAAAKVRAGMAKDAVKKRANVTLAAIRSAGDGFTTLFQRRKKSSSVVTGLKREPKN